VKSEALLRGKFIPLHTCVRKAEISLSTEMKSKPKASTRKETIKIMAEINQVQNKKAKEKSPKSPKYLVTPNIGSLRKTNKLDKSLARLPKKKGRGFT
jgi:uncharacterized Zn-finger protein